MLLFVAILDKNCNLSKGIRCGGGSLQLVADATNDVLVLSFSLVACLSLMLLNTSVLDGLVLKKSGTITHLLDCKPQLTYHEYRSLPGYRLRQRGSTRQR